MSVPLRRSAPNDYRGFIPQRPMSGGPMVAPPLPPRTSVSIGTPGSIYGTQFGGSYGSPYSGGLFGPSYNMGYSFRSPYSSRYGYGDYGSDDPHSPFQSVESIVRAISSLSMMVESTYQSMSMSFQAVLGVAENMDQLRRIVLDIFGSLTLVKTFFWFCKKILYILGLMKNNPVREKAWEAAAAEVVGSSPAGATRRTWPLIAFFGLMCGGPYILYKLASPVNQPPWDPKVDGGIKCVAVHDFDSVRQGDLSFRRREVLIRHNQLQGGWALACNKNGRIGYVPADRLKPISQTPTGARGDFPVKVYTQGSYDTDWIEGPNGNPVPNYTFGVADARIPSSVPVNVPQCEDGTYTGTYMIGTHPVSRVVRPSPPAPVAPSAAARPTTSSVTVKSDNPSESATILTDPNQQD